MNLPTAGLSKAGPPDQPSLRISYLFPQFPISTEAFAVSDIGALRALGHQVVVHTVKARRRGEAEYLRSSNVPADLAIHRASLRGALRWPLLVWKMRAEAVYLVRQIASGTLKPLGTRASALLCIPRVLEMAGEIGKLDADIVHVFWSRHAGMVLSVLGQRRSRSLRSAFVGAYDLIADDFLVDLALGWSEVVYSHAETNRAYLEAKAPGGTPVRIILRGIPLMTPDPAIVRDPALWVTASALSVPKNVEAVLQTFAQARSSRPDLKLEVFGDGPDRRRLEQCSQQLGCADAVRFRGHVEREVLFGHMQRAAAFLLLSKKPSERLPNVVKEALWAGCAIISSRSEGIEELVPDSQIGLVIDPDDADARTTAMQTILQETQDQAALRRDRARTLIAERFSNQLSMGEYVAAWQAVLAARAPGTSDE